MACSTQLLGHGDFRQGYIRRWYRHDDLNDEKQENYADWDFVNTWGIDADENNGYPFLALVVAVPDTEPPVWAEVSLKLLT